MGVLRLKRGTTKPALAEGEPWFNTVKKILHIGNDIQIGHETIVNVYPGDNLKTALDGITDATAVKPYTVNIYGGVHDGGNDSFAVKPYIHINRIGNPTITSDNATGTIVAVKADGTTVEDGVGTASITGKGKIVNTTDAKKRIVGHIDFEEVLILQVFVIDGVTATARPLRNDFSSDITTDYTAYDEESSYAEVNILIPEVIQNTQRFETIAVLDMIDISGGVIVLPISIGNGVITMHYPASNGFYFELHYTQYYV